MRARRTAGRTVRRPASTRPDEALLERVRDAYRDPATRHVHGERVPAVVWVGGGPSWRGARRLIGGRVMTLLGRTRELAVVSNVLRAAGEGRGGVLVVRGPAGIGKSALVTAAVEAAPHLRVLYATGTEFESDLPFAGLHQLCQPVLERLAELPAPQATALGHALGLDTGPVAPDAGLLVGAGLLSLLTAAARTRPLVCVVDDAQWMDPASTAALAFAARRLSAVPVAVVVVVRDGDDQGAGPDVLTRLPELRLEGLPEREARELLDAEVRAPLDPRVRDRVVAEARGNPLALLELPRTVGPAALAGGYELPGGSVSGALEASFRQRLSLLPPPAQAFAALASAEPTGDPDLLRRAAREMGLAVDVAGLVEETGLVSMGVRVRFRHPLVRSAVYHATSPGQRRAVHRALAAATDLAVDPHRRAWHLAMAADGPDEAVADELERSAGQAQLRGGVAAAAAFLERAAVLTPDPVRRAGRLLEAASAKRAAGAPETALQLVSVAESAGLDRRQRALAGALRARTAFDQRQDAGAVGLLVQAARSFAEADPATAREALLEAYAVALYAGRFADPDAVPQIAAVARSLPAGEAPTRPLDLLLDGLLTLATRGRAHAVDQLRRGVAMSVDDDDAPLTSGYLWMAASAAHELWDEEGFRLLAEQQLARVRRAGAVAALILALGTRALSHVHTGRFAQAQVLVGEAHRVADELGVPPMLTVPVIIAAWQGDEPATTRIVQAASADAAMRREGGHLSVMEYATALLLNAQGRYGEALDACRTAVDLHEQDVRVWLLPEFVEAAVRAGRRDLAVPVHERLREGVELLRSDWAAGTVARCAALLAEGEEAEEQYRAAVEHLSRTAAAPQLARAHLLYGEWLRREGRKREARERLRLAHDAFSGLGATAFAARAARELAATGERARTRGATGDEQRAQLTAQELQVARAVAAGATSKEVAAELFLSPRTVDAHLRNIFAKLGITSRRQLRHLPLPAGPRER
ncbi:ATP-binding protein [Kineococcus arenarius]|uniref:ATP-binding protein n=1 Tax=Kineococcus sp. SYSU DK021 TaxID=3383142 RepID=UPI003D7D61EF